MRENPGSQPTVTILGMHDGHRSYQLQERELNREEVERLLEDLKRSPLITNCTVSGEIHTKKGIERRLTIQHPENVSAQTINSHVMACLERRGFIAMRNARGLRE